MNIEIREPKDNELNFVISNWLKNYQQYSQFAKRIPRDIFFKNHEPIVKDIIDRSHVAVAVDPIEDLLLGFICWEYDINKLPIIHYVYVKEAFRRFGIGNRLIGGPGIPDCQFTHWTKDCSWIVGSYKEKGKHPNLIYNPYLIGRDNGR